MAVGFRGTAGRAGAAIALLAGLLAPAARAARPGELTAGPPGKIVDLPEARGEGELVALDARLAPSLLELAAEEGATVADFPVAPGVRRAVRLVRHEVWDGDAKVLLVGPSGTTPLPRSPLVFFWGGDLEGAGVRTLVWIDPATRALKSLVHSADGPQELAKAPDGRHLLAAPVRPKDANVRCGQEEFPETAALPSSSAARAAQGRTALSLGALHQAVLAIDTDTEYVASFPNPTAVTNYIATLVASINVMYERDLNLRLVVGTTILRTAADPWTVAGSPAGIGHLNEFTNYWNANHPKSGTPRSFAALLSGKATGGSISGIAWLANSVCGGGSDYSFNEISSNGAWLDLDTLIVGHEIGHNMGSPHTHCYPSPAPDRCYSGEACYGGPTSCPAATTINGVPNVTGTIMSYCHTLGGGCSTSLVFHPTTVSAFVGPVLDAGAAATPVPCIVPVVPPPPAPPAVSPPTTFHPVTPCRVLDTRNAPGPLGGPSLGGGSTRAFTLAGTCGVPVGAIAVSANVTTTNVSAAGSVVVYPNGIAVAPGTSTVSVRAGKTRANNAVLYVASDGSVLVQNASTGPLDLVLDVNGYFQ